ncbi:DnaA N-terminal domain-containing protein [Paenibacillus sp. FSL P4-0338]|uniref:DnaA N-terminal domain-containing protein n=1 Tax=Paenibacillus sp. FSL P4-0338 TaxID=2921635 RepID=UPI0030F7DF85
MWDEVLRRVHALVSVQDSKRMQQSKLYALTEHQAAIWTRSRKLKILLEQRYIGLISAVLFGICGRELNLLFVTKGELSMPETELDLYWIYMLEELRKKLSEPVYKAFFEPTRLVFLSDTLAIIRTPSVYAKDWLSVKYTKLVKDLFEQLMSQKPDLLFTE